MDGPKRILLADDDANDVALTLKALARHELDGEVCVVSDGVEALDYLFRRGAYRHCPQGHPALVMLDIKMPKLDGMEVLRQIKRDPELCVVPVVMLTSSREEKDLLASYRLGVNAYVVKPVGFHEFADAVGEVGLFWAVVNEPPPGTVVKQTNGLSQSKAHDRN